MHYLLIPYAFLSFSFVVQFHSRGDITARTALVITAGVTLALIFMAIAARPVSGDSWRYYNYFLMVRSIGLQNALAYRDPDLLYMLLNWSVGGLGRDSGLLFSATLLVYMSVFVAAINRLVGLSGTAVLVMCYAAFPYFIAYGANGLRQGLALVFLLMALTQFYQGRRAAWVWLVLAPLWHSGAWLAFVVVAAHWFMCRLLRSEQLRWSVVLVALVSSILLSASGLNEPLLSRLPDFVDLQQSHEIYFMDADMYGYRSGFRWDFLLFSLVPLASGLMLRRISPTFRYLGSGWWLSMYLSLNIIYHLFSFAPFSDRFAAFSWFLMPLVVYLQVAETRRKNDITLFVLAISVVNVVMLQAYTGNFLQVPRWW